MVWPLTIEDTLDSPKTMDSTQINETESQAAAASQNRKIAPIFDPIPVDVENEETTFADPPLIPEGHVHVGGVQQELEVANTSLLDTDCQQLAGILANQPEIRIEPLQLPSDKSRKKSATEKQLDMLSSVNAPGNRDTLPANCRRKTLPPLPQAKQKYLNTLAELKQDLAEFFQSYTPKEDIPEEDIPDAIVA